MATGVTEAPYTRDILRLAVDIPGRVGFGELEDASELRSRSCGARVAVAVELDEAGRVRSIAQAVEACAFGQAAAAIMGRHAVGKSADEIAAAIEGIERWLQGGDTASTVWPELEILAPVLDRSARHPAILLSFQALEVAMRKAAR